MSEKNIGEKTIPAFWALVLLFGLIGVFIVDSYSTAIQERSLKKGCCGESYSDVGEGIIFTGSESTFSNLEGGEDIEMICHYDNSLESESEIKGEVIFTKESGEKYLVLSTKKEKLVQGKGKMITKFEAPSYLPSGDYSGLIKIYTFPDNEYRGGCGLPLFSLSNKTSVMISEMISPEAKESFVPVLDEGEKKISFGVKNLTEAKELNPTIVIFDLLTEEIVLEKRLKAISLEEDESKEVDISLTEFNKLGAYRAELSLDKDNSLVAASPYTVLYFGQKPQLMELGFVEKDDIYEFKVGYAVKPRIIDQSLEVLIAVRDAQGKECGFNKYSSFNVWPDDLEVKKNFNCDESEVSIAFKPKGSDKYLEVFKKKL